MKGLNVMFPINRLPVSFQPPPAEPEPPPRQSVADRLLTGAWSAKIELLRFTDDDGTSELSCNVELHTSIDGNPADVLAGLLAQFRDGNGGEEAVAQ
jgi:hypothetical protein